MMGKKKRDKNVPILALVLYAEKAGKAISDLTEDEKARAVAEFALAQFGKEWAA